MRRCRGAARETEEDFHELVPALYEAALGSLPWAAVLPQIVRFLGAERGGLGARARGAEAGFLLFHDLDVELIERWGSEFSGYDPWVERFGDRRRVGELLHGGSEPFLADMRKTAVYSEIFDPLGIDDLVAMPVARRGTWMGYVGAYRSRAEGLFEEGDVARARLLAPHLVRAVEIHERIGALGEQASAAEAVLEWVPYGVLLIEANGALLWANRRGECCLRAENVIALRAGAVRAREPSLDAELSAACAAAVRIAAGSAARVSPRIWSARDETGRRLEIMVVPVGRHARGSTLSFTAQPPRVALVVAEPTTSTPLSAGAVGEALQLPPSLARLAAAIGSGTTIAEYAEEAGVSEGTARQQLKEVLERGGVHRQADLVRLLQRSLAALATRAPSSD